MAVTKQLMGLVDFYSIFSSTMEVNGTHKLLDYPYSSKCLLLCSAEERYRFGTSGWV